MSLRLPEEDHAALKALAESLGLMPIDLIRAAVRGLLAAANSGGGEVRLPIHVRGEGEREAWSKVLARLDALLTAEGSGAPPTYPPLTIIEQHFPALLNSLNEYGKAAGLAETGVSLRIVDKKKAGGSGFYLRAEIDDAGKK